jgi:hypothetical protein
MNQKEKVYLENKRKAIICDFKNNENIKIPKKSVKDNF